MRRNTESVLTASQRQNIRLGNYNDLAVDLPSVIRYLEKLQNVNHTMDLEVVDIDRSHFLQEPSFIYRFVITT